MLKKFAYVSLLYGNSNYFLGALLLGYSLYKTKSPYDKVLLVTKDIPEQQINVLSQYFKIIKINPIPCNEQYIKKDRFKDVFTKMQMFKLIQYDKIMMLDTDMLILKNMDHLFNLPSPAASSSRITIKHGQIISKDRIIKDGKIVGRINAGLMILKPDIKTYNFICNDILKEKDIDMKHEQDYLSWFYAGKWTYIFFLYNYEVARSLKNIKYKFKTEHIYNLHYSSRYKPWDFLDKKYYDKFKSSLHLDKKRIIEHYDLWLDIYGHIYSKFKGKGIDLDKLYIHSNPWEKIVDMRLKRK